MMSMGEFPANYNTLSTASPEALDYRMAQVEQEREDALHERDDALLALRDIVKVGSQVHLYMADYTGSKRAIMAIAKKALEAD